MSQARALAAAAGLAAALAACTPVGPDYAPPAMEAGSAFGAATPEFVGAGTVDTAWWTRFDDPRVAELIRRGLAANPEIAAAAERLAEAEALRRSARSDRFPTLDGEIGSEGGYTRRLAGETGVGGGDGEVSGEASGAAILGWTADLFGGQRRAEEAAEAERVRRAWLREAVALDVAGEVAATYVDLRGRERRLDLGLESLDLQERTLDLVRNRVAAGLAPDLDRSRAEAAVARLRAELAPLRADIRRDRDALAVLLGEPPSVFALPPAPPDAPPAIPGLVAGPPLGLPADLLRRRPDLKAAEYALVGATAEIGVARAALYPELTLPGRLSLSATDLGTGDLVSTVVATLGATLDIPLFDAGGRAAQVDAAEARAREALLIYRTTLLTALQEVEGAMHDYRGARDRLAALDIAVEANRRAVEQSRGLYTGGLVSFTDVLDSQRALTESLQQRAVARADVTQAAIALYRAAGFAPCLTAEARMADAPEECPDAETAAPPPTS